MEPILYKRQITDLIVKYLSTRDIIVLHGARQVGKTSILGTGRRFTTLNSLSL